MSNKQGFEKIIENGIDGAHFAASKIVEGTSPEEVEQLDTLSKKLEDRLDFSREAVGEPKLQRSDFGSDDEFASAKLEQNEIVQRALLEGYGVSPDEKEELDNTIKSSILDKGKTQDAFSELIGKAIGATLFHSLWVALPLANSAAEYFLDDNKHRQTGTERLDDIENSLDITTASVKDKIMSGDVLGGLKELYSTISGEVMHAYDGDSSPNSSPDTSSPNKEEKDSVSVDTLNDLSSKSQEKDVDPLSKTLGDNKENDSDPTVSSGQGMGM